MEGERERNVENQSWVSGFCSWCFSRGMRLTWSVSMAWEQRWPWEQEYLSFKTHEKVSIIKKLVYIPKKLIQASADITKTPNHVPEIVQTIIKRWIPKNPRLREYHFIWQGKPPGNYSTEKDFYQKGVIRKQCETVEKYQSGKPGFHQLLPAAEWVNLGG